MTASQIIQRWPEQSREAALLVIEAYGEPQEMTDSQLTWRSVGPWKRVVATSTFYEHEFPAPHIDAVESFIDYRVPVEKVSPLAAFDGSVVVERTAGELSARCHDVQANFLALNLAHDIVTDQRTVDEARAYYAKEFLDARRNQPTPYMEGLRFSHGDGDTTDRDQRLPSTTTLSAPPKRGSAPRPRIADGQPDAGGWGPAMAPAAAAASPRSRPPSEPVPSTTNAIYSGPCS